jgi:hypothetical protein
MASNLRSLVLGAVSVAACAAALYAAPAPDQAKPNTLPATQPAVASLRLEPPEIHLVGPRSEGRFVATARRADGTLEDATSAVLVRVADAKIARVVSGRILRPVGNGETTLTVAYGGRTASVKVRVKEAATPTPIEFGREVVPILTKAGCNQGTCHGSQYGKGGFKLSLSGFDPEQDYYTIVKQSGGRRARLTDPARSLFLLKPTLGVAHQGGLRLKPGSSDYQRIVAWMQDGAPKPTPKDPYVTRLDAFPKQRVLAPGGRQTLVVWATYSDGQIRDVTAWTRLNTLNDAVASVSVEGMVEAVSRGETSIMVRFGGQATVSSVSVPFAKLANYPQLPQNNYVDAHVTRKWKTLGLIPSGLCDDATFIRRLFFDVIGTPPTPDDVKTFLADKTLDKRSRLINTVLERPEYADYWTLKWGDLLRSNRNTLGSPKGMWSLTNWIRAQLRDNRPADQFSRSLITAQGSTYTTGPANYYRVATNPPDLAETTAQVFLGMRLQCVRCHHHPFERWSQDDYYRFAGFFARVGLKGSNEFGIFGGEQVVRINQGGEVYHPKNGALMKPAPLGGYPRSMMVAGPKTADLVDPNPDSNGDRRSVLADWIANDNPLFARNIVNRYWGYLMGRGLVEPIDDQRVTNPPTNPELLDALAKDFIAHKYDIKHLIRIICNSRAYQLSSDATKENMADTTFYSHYTIKRLPAEVMLDALNAATGTTVKFDGLPPGTRAIQLPDPNVNSYFLDTFGRAPRVQACECERAAEPNMGQALHLMMSDLVNRKVQDGTALPAKLMAAKKSDAEIIEAFYLAALSRPPTADEKQRALRAVRDFAERPGMLPAKRLFFIPPMKVSRTQEARARDRKAALEDVMWALLNGKEFMFNH